MKKLRVKTVILFLLSGAALAAGLLSGEFRAVWEKAVRVCLSCIGIG
jgi:hypothetical protein